MKQKRILLIDDDLRIGHLFKRMLHEPVYDVTTAGGGEDGIVAAKTIQPDIIFCDIVMPELNGYEVLKHIKNDTSTRAIPFIFISSKTDTADFLTGMSKGADGYFGKPITREELIEIIETHLV